VKRTPAGHQTRATLRLTKLQACHGRYAWTRTFTDGFSQKSKRNVGETCLAKAGQRGADDSALVKPVGNDYVRRPRSSIWVRSRANESILRIVKTQPPGGGRSAKLAGPASRVCSRKGFEGRRHCFEGSGRRGAACPRSLRARLPALSCRGGFDGIRSRKSSTSFCGTHRGSASTEGFLPRGGGYRQFLCAGFCKRPEPQLRFEALLEAASQRRPFSRDATPTAKIYSLKSSERGLYGGCRHSTNRQFKTVWRSSVYLSEYSCALCSCDGILGPALRRGRSGVGRAAATLFLTFQQQQSSIKRMGRRHHARTRPCGGELLAKASARIPGGFVLRTTCISGVPGRTVEEHEEVRISTKVQCERCGAFPIRTRNRTPAVRSSRTISSQEEKPRTRRRDHGRPQQPIAFGPRSRPDRQRSSRSPWSKAREGRRRRRERTPRAARRLHGALGLGRATRSTGVVFVERRLRARAEHVVRDEVVARRTATTSWRPRSPSREPSALRPNPMPSGSRGPASGGDSPLVRGDRQGIFPRSCRTRARSRDFARASGCS